MVLRAEVERAEGVIAGGEAPLWVGERGVGGVRKRDERGLVPYGRMPSSSSDSANVGYGRCRRLSRRRLRGRESPHGVIVRRVPFTLERAMDDLTALFDKLLKIQALRMGATTAGEREAAAAAAKRVEDRINEKLGQSGANIRPEPETEWAFTVNDMWSKQLLIALLRQHGLTPYRRYRQRRTTVRVRATDRLINETVWPTYLEMSDILQEHLAQVTDRVIREVLHQNPTEDEVDEVAGELEE
jgi:hypothetical protein